MEALQQFVDKASENWTEGLDFKQYIATLDEKQTLAVLVAKLNYQIGNGGFHQWHENGYSEQANTLLVQLSLYKKEPIIAQVMEIIERALRVINKYQEDIDDYNSDGEYDEAEETARVMVDALEQYDDKYDEIEDEFLAYIEKICTRG